MRVSDFLLRGGFDHEAVFVVLASPPALWRRLLAAGDLGWARNPSAALLNRVRKLARCMTSEGYTAEPLPVASWRKVEQPEWGDGPWECVGLPARPIAARLEGGPTAMIADFFAQLPPAATWPKQTRASFRRWQGIVYGAVPNFDGTIKVRLPVGSIPVDQTWARAVRQANRFFHQILPPEMFYAALQYNELECTDEEPCKLPGLVDVPGVLDLIAMLHTHGFNVGYFAIAVFNRCLGGDMVFPPFGSCLLYTSPSPRDRTRSRMPSSA